MSSHSPEKAAAEPSNELTTLPPQSSATSRSTMTVTQQPSTEPNDDDAETRMNSEILQLASRYTAAPHATGSGCLFPAKSDGPLDPSSLNFNARKWAKSFYNAHTDVSNGAPPMTTRVKSQQPKFSATRNKLE